MSAFRHVAPAGTPVSARNLLEWAWTSRRWRAVEQDLSESIRLRFGVEHAFLVSTGRAGLTVILEALRTQAGTKRTHVVLPSYTCYSVAASIVKAGLVPHVVDVDPATLDFDRAGLERLDTGNVLAIVATSLYGLPANLPAIERFARERGIYLVDDSAQSMGASIGGRACGTFGDVGLYSFDKGKTLSAIDGGVIVTSSAPLAEALRRIVAQAPEPSGRTQVQYVIKALIYSAFLRPMLYGIPNSIPALGLGVTRYTTDYPFTRYSPVLASLALTMLPQLDGLIASRISNAERMLGEIAGESTVAPVVPLPGSRPTYTRLPLLVAPALRERLLKDLRAAGIGATGSYPASIADVPELRAVTAGLGDAAGGRLAAARILTLPTHPYMSERDIRRAGAVIRGLASSAPAVSSAQFAAH